jgi:hypothetical protein
MDRFIERIACDAYVSVGGGFGYCALENHYPVRRACPRAPPIRPAPLSGSLPGGKLTCRPLIDGKALLSGRVKSPRDRDLCLVYFLASFGDFVLGCLADLGACGLLAASTLLGALSFFGFFGLVSARIFSAS